MGAIGEQLHEASVAFRDVFRNRGLRRINLALAGSVIGDWAYSIAVSIWAYQQGGAGAVGLFGAARLITMSISGPLLATLADRLPRRRVMIGADLVRVVLVAAGAVAIEVDAAPIVVYGLALLVSIAGTAFRPAQASLLPVLARTPQELTGANVVSSTIESIGFFVGPALGALLLAVADLSLVYAVNAATFAWSALILMGVPAAAPVPSAPTRDAAEAAVEEAGSETADVDAEDVAEPAGFLATTLAGFRAIAANPQLRLITLIYTAQTVVAGASAVYEVTIALELLDLGESGLGLLDAVLGVGGLVGGMVAMVLATRERLATDFGVGVVLWSAPLLLIVAWPNLGVTLVAMILIGLANSLVDINAFTIVQRIAPPEVMGRVFGALESLLILGMALGSLIMPVLIEWLGLRSGLAVVGAGVATLALAGMAGLIRIDTSVLAPPGLALLRKVPMLAALPAPSLERLAHSLVAMSVPGGQPVFLEGDRGDRFWVIERGTAEVSVKGEHVRDLGPGDSFGEIALLRDVPRTASVIAGPDGLELRGLDRGDFIPAVTGHGESAQVADAVVERLLAFA